MLLKFLKKCKTKIINLILVVLFIVGWWLFLHPTISQYRNSVFQNQAITDYSKVIADYDITNKKKILSEAVEYNKGLAQKGIQWFLSDEDKKKYYETLDVTGTGMMGYIEIPKLDVTLSIYHGTEENIFQVAVGHIDGTSLPVGGENSHCVLIGHRGLPSARLFTDLDRMEIGDLFMINVLDQVYTYAVDQISIVEPKDLSSLKIERGMDLCTLVTCTPYGVNSHRLLVRGSRIENADALLSVRVTADAVLIDPLIVAVFIAIIIFVLLIILLLIATRGNERSSYEDEF